jgi:CRISPR-associated exonuclease Cas4
MNDEIKNNKNFKLPTTIKLPRRTENHVPIHLLYTQAYCERQIYLEYIKGVEALPTQEMIKGSEKHGSLEQEHKEKAEIELSISDAFLNLKRSRLFLHQEKYMSRALPPSVGLTKYSLHQTD